MRARLCHLGRAALTFCTTPRAKNSRTGRTYPMHIHLRLLFTADAISTLFSRFPCPSIPNGTDFEI